MSKHSVTGSFAVWQVVTEAPSLITHMLDECRKKALHREKERINGSGVIRADSLSTSPFNAGSRIRESAIVELLKHASKSLNDWCVASCSAAV